MKKNVFLIVYHCYKRSVVKKKSKYPFLDTNFIREIMEMSFHN